MILLRYHKTRATTFAENGDSPAPGRNYQLISAFAMMAPVYDPTPESFVPDSTSRLTGPSLGGNSQSIVTAATLSAHIASGERDRMMADVLAHVTSEQFVSTAGNVYVDTQSLDL